MSATQRATDMMKLPMKELPPIAQEFAQELCRKYGMCGEIFQTAYMVYAQIVEKKTCRDDLYWPDKHAIQFFKDRGHEYTDVKRRQPGA